MLKLVASKEIYTRCSQRLSSSFSPDFSGNLRAQNINRAQTKRASITDMQYFTSINMEWCQLCLKLILFITFSLCANSHLLPLSVAAASRCCCSGPPL